MNDSPITQVILTVQFAPPVNFSPAQVSDAFNEFRSELPVFEQVGRAGPMPVDPAQVIIAAPFGPARNLFRLPDSALSLAFQEDRFTFGWARVITPDAQPDYPGYLSVIEQAIQAWERLRAHLFEKSPDAVVAEIIYTNAFPVGRPERRLSSVYQFLNPEFQVAMAGYSFSWTEPAPPNGFVTTTANGPISHPQSGNLSTLQLTGRFRIEGSWAGLRDSFDRAHDAISKVFANAVNPEFRPT